MFSLLWSIIVSCFSIVFGFFVGGVGYIFVDNQILISKTPVYASGEIAFHFIELGNEYTGDCTYIKAGDVDILIDAGSRVSSIPSITSYINNYVKDGKLEYVIVTHAHQDHYAGFATGQNTDSIFDLYEIDIIIDFAQATDDTKEKTIYKNYQRELSEAVSRGATHFTALECVNKENDAKDVYELTNNITMTILNQRFYSEKTKNENDNSVCTLFTHENKNFLFTGDLDIDGEESLVALNNLPECELYKAGHHGSKTSSNEVLLNAIKPKICCVCCCAGNVEYTQNLENTFPTQEFIDRISEYTDAVYVTTLGPIVFDNEKDKYVNNGFTSMNGNIQVISDSSGVNVNCSNNNKKLKETDWFKEYRDCPVNWAS